MDTVNHGARSDHAAFPDLCAVKHYGSRTEHDIVPKTHSARWARAKRKPLLVVHEGTKEVRGGAERRVEEGRVSVLPSDDEYGINGGFAERASLEDQDLVWVWKEPQSR